ncbi:GNAT family N-acetyltransferase [Methanoregula formicica]|uniref:Acetyltransferase, ribosomal protein N-acetylase n=1 Tax=Methanoregula formicica (strain DSM 22288 / NBRC 105244 / SMSP) TaxID=593750 RepID=L0HDY8_METFS|nr:GNAT family N-acetyltransferase [Methanoregula formicica]AGB01304.1 acetyltransferase, ribosomal protein N-acetylase [Methanoregula formicica SMSP]
MKTPLQTKRLSLIPATREILEADLNDREQLSSLLDATIPAGWPQPLMDEGVIREFLRMMKDPAEPLFAAWYWVLDDTATGTGILIGNGGILSAEGHPNTAVLGYSVLEEFWNRGYATEAVGALIPVIFSLPGIRGIIATTYPHLTASIRVLEKNGFVRTDEVPSGVGAEEGTICYLREKQGPVSGRE